MDAQPPTGSDDEIANLPLDRIEDDTVEFPEREVALVNDKSVAEVTCWGLDLLSIQKPETTLMSVHEQKESNSCAPGLKRAHDRAHLQ
jgi:hypothetical protein